MDAVITYVNGLDPVWQAQYAQITQQPVLQKRFRDWGLLPYLFRGIEQYLPFVERIFLVVSSDSQVPEWVNRQTVQVVLHEQIIPAPFLPTFNSSAIEMFLRCIPDLSEQFLYLNDDCFPVLPMSPDLFFTANGGIATHFQRHFWALDKYKKRCRQADHLARLAVERNGGSITNKASWGYVRPQHTCTPMLRTASEEAFEAVKAELLKVITPLRSAYNVNQYFFTDYLYYSGRAVNKRLATKHCSMAVYSAPQIAEFVVKPVAPWICINDVSMSEIKESQMRAALQTAFEQRFPAPSRFEK